MQGLLILKIHVCLERRFFCLCRFPVGFQLVAAVALFQLPRSKLCATLGGFLALVCALHAGIVLFNGMYLIVDERCV